MRNDASIWLHSLKGDQEAIVDTDAGQVAIMQANLRWICKRFKRRGTERL